MPKTNHRFLKALRPHQRELIDLIVKEGAISRTELTQFTGASRAKITVVIRELIDLGILAEHETELPHTGKRTRLLDFDDQLGFIVSIHIDDAEFEIVLGNLNRLVIERRNESIDITLGPEAILTRCCDVISEMLAHHALSSDQIFGIGVGLPGPLEFPSGRINAPSIMFGWEGFEIRGFLQIRFPIALVVVDSDVNILALGEQRIGKCRGVDNFIVIKLDTSINASIGGNGQIYRGNNGYAGDIGHICAQNNGAICRCGNVGCLEVVAANRAIVVQATRAATNDKSEFLRKRFHEQQNVLTIQDVTLAAAMGDTAAIEIIQNSAHAIGDVLAGLVNFFNPLVILISTSAMRRSPQFLPAVHQSVLHHALPLVTKGLQIDYASADKDIFINGAISLVFNQLESARETVG